MTRNTFDNFSGFPDINDMPRFSNTVQETQAGVVTLTKDDTKDFQSAQVIIYDTAVDIYSHTPYGLSTRAPTGAYGPVTDIESTESRYSILGYPQKRFKGLKDWEVQLGNYLTRSSIKFDEDKDIVIDSKNDINIIAEGDVSITCANLNIICTGKVTVTATEIDFGSTTMKHAGKVVDSTHLHTGSPTAPIGAVSNTGAVV